MRSGIKVVVVIKEAEVTAITDLNVVHWKEETNNNNTKKKFDLDD